MSDIRESLNELKAKMGEGSIDRMWALPGNDAFMMGCGKCGNQHFLVEVTPISTTAQIRSVICNRCKKPLRVTGEGIIDGNGKVSLDLDR